MTIIAAAEDKNGYWIGSDSHGNSSGICTELGSKLIHKDKYIVGFSNSYRVRDIILENNQFPKTIGSIKGLRNFRDILKELMIQDGCMPMGNHDDTVIHPISLLIISNSGMYNIDTDYQIHKIKKYIAIGSGTEIALGALRSTLNITGSAAEAVRLAIEAAIYHCATCGGNIHIDHILKKGQQ